MAAPQPATSPRRSRGFSVKSEDSHHSGASGHKSHLSESSQEKARRSLHTKADPLVAMNELQPMAVALEKSNLGSLRDMQHKDQYGNIITDPDLSNPTRPRFERPLDTIRSFEAAIYGTNSNNRASYARTEDAASQVGDYSRRTSYYGGANGYTNRGYSDYYGGRTGPSRPDSMIDSYQGQPQDAGYYPYSQSSQRRPRQYSPMSTDQAAYAQYGYPQQNYQHSHDNVTALSGSGSGYTDPYGQSTDPSSLNSSIDQLQQQALQQQRMDERAQYEYGYQGYGGGTYANDNNFPLPSAPAPAPVADPSWGGPVGGTPSAKPTNTLRKTPSKANPDEKRKSWFKRRFSKD